MAKNTAQNTLQKLKIATLASHSALQILKGARDEGFSTVLICTPKNKKLYDSFGLADELISINSYADFPSIEEELAKKNVVIVPHGSFVAYLSLEKNKSMRLAYYGNKDVLDWEADRKLQYKWMNEAGLRTPRFFKTPADVDAPAIIKTYGAAGGKGYFFAKNPTECENGIKNLPPGEKYVIQEYIIGVTMYIHYFYSPLTKKLEIMSMDRRYETNVDSLGRIPLKSQRGIEIEPSFVVVGNAPLVLRESLLAEAYDMGERIVASSQKLMPPRGLFGPFCLETVITPDQKFYVIEISARIVAGTNLFMNGSPYSWLSYNEPMSTGRRIAREIKNAVKQNRLGEILG